LAPSTPGSRHARTINAKKWNRRFIMYSRSSHTWDLPRHLRREAHISLPYSEAPWIFQMGAHLMSAALPCKTVSLPEVANAGIKRD
jgi:hypothetical protein